MNRINEKAVPSLKKELIRFADPVLIYTTVAMTAIMYHFYDIRIFLYGILSFASVFLLFRFFDFINAHRLIGAITYIAAWFVVFYSVGICMEQGRKDYPIGFYLWFFTPQTAMDYNKWYSFAIFQLFVMFMASVIYYFTKIRYRLFMNFLVFIIPFVIYGKEAEKMPVPFIILLAAGFIILIFYCRQLSNDEYTVVVNRREIVSAAGVFTVIFAVAASVIPKPEIKEDRSRIEKLISAERFTDKLVEKLAGFRDTSSGGQFRSINTDTVLYLASAEEPLRLKTATFSDYSYQSDSWSAGKDDFAYKEKYSDTPIEISRTGELTEALLLAGKLDSEFAAKYSLSEFDSLELFVPQKKRMTISSVFQDNKAAPVPQLAERLLQTTYDGEIITAKNGLILSGDNRFSRNERFIFEYSPDQYFAAGENKRFIDSFSGSEYYSLLIDAKNVLKKKYYDAKDDETFKSAFKLLENESESYCDYTSKLLDYDNKKRIAELAEQITEGLTSDYDKAKAIEIYFYSNDYIYDLDYLKSNGENVENFLFNTKRGVCYEYATAMVLLARSVGIPARYCEGYNMSDAVNDSDSDFNYRITTMNSHGFPELYIKGFGWLSFEPTISDSVQEQKTAASSLLARAGIMILIAAVLLLAAVILYPWFAHRLFLFLSRNRSSGKTASEAMYRICRLYKIGAENTSDEVKKKVQSSAGADISALSELFDKSVYGEIVLTEKDKEKILEDYTNAYIALREKKRKKKKSKRLNMA